MRTVAFWVLSVAMSVTMAVRPALAHSDDPSFEGCHSSVPDGPQHCHYEHHRDLGRREFRLSAPRDVPGDSTEAAFTLALSSPLDS